MANLMGMQPTEKRPPYVNLVSGCCTIAVRFHTYNVVILAANGLGTAGAATITNGRAAQTDETCDIGQNHAEQAKNTSNDLRVSLNISLEFIHNVGNP